MKGPLKIFSGRSNEPLASKIAMKAGVELGALDVRQFSDSEIWVKFGENVRGCSVYLVQSTHPPTDNLMELLIMVDAAKRASAQEITAVIPYFGYARQDRKDQPRVSITAKLIANLLTVAGVNRIITMDLHAPQIQGFFDIPFDHLYGFSVFLNYAKIHSDNLVVVSPDVGGIKTARAYAKRYNAGLVVIDKRRPRPNSVEVLNVIGDVQGKDVIIVDDIIDTAGTFAGAINAVAQNGAKNIYGLVTHGLLSGRAIELLESSQLNKLYVLDTINPERRANTEKIEVLSSADVFADAILRTHQDRSISSLFEI